MKQRYDIFGLGLMLFSSAVIVFTAIAGPFLTELQAKGFYDLLKDWQTLMAGALAIVAALIAAHPVYKQLSKMNVQSAIMARNVLVERLSATEKRKKRTQELLLTVTDEFMRDLFWNDPEGDPEFNAEWAFNSQSKTNSVIDQLEIDQKQKQDSQVVDGSRRVAIQVAHTLSDCLDCIHRPDSSDLTDPFYGLTANDIEKIEQKSEKARLSLIDNINLLSQRRDALDAVFENEVELLRQRIRNIDDLIVKDELVNN